MELLKRYSVQKWVEKEGSWTKKEGPRRKQIRDNGLKTNYTTSHIKYNRSTYFS